MSDYDVETIYNTLKKEEYINERVWQTPLLTDEEGEYYVITDIYIDEDGDVRFTINRL